MSNRTDRREQVRANARYLRAVRPIDPDEIADYVEGRPHPAVVRELLREEAPDLGLVERADGTFVPVPEGPFDPDFDGVGELPERIERALETLLVERYGPAWDRGDAGDRLRGTIRRLKADYYRQHPVEYDADVALAYACYHLPDYYAIAQYVVDELGRDGRLDRELRVLDVGAGVGGPALGLHDYLFGAGDPADPGTADRALVDYHAVEPSAAADVLDALLAETGPNFHPTIHRTTAEAFDPDAIDGADPDPEVDLLLFANVLSELDAPADVVERYLDALAPDGSAILVAPADRNTSTNLRAVERELADERAVATVYAPTVRLWPEARPTDRGWSFDRRPDLAVPSIQRRLAAEAADPDAMTNTSLKYSWAILRTDGRRRIDLTLSRDEALRMADADEHVTRRVDVVACKLSHDLRSGDESADDDANPVFKVSDGSESVEHYAVLVRETALNATLRTAGYGALLSVENALLLWNDDEDAYNLVVDEGTVVDAA